MMLKTHAKSLVLTGLLLASTAAMTTGAHGHAASDGGHDKAPLDLSKLGGPFSLTDEHGRTVTDKDFRGRYVLLYFGYERCSDACPTVLDTMGAAIDELGPAAERITPVFVDFDRVHPASAPPPTGGAGSHRQVIALPQMVAHRHTDAQADHPDHAAPTAPELGAWVRKFHPRFVALTGNRKQIFDITRKFRVRREHAPARHKEKAYGFRINHTTHVYLLNPAGKVAAVFYYGESADTMAAKIKAQMAPRRTPAESAG